MFIAIAYKVRFVALLPGSGEAVRTYGTHDYREARAASLGADRSFLTEWESIFTLRLQRHSLTVISHMRQNRLSNAGSNLSLSRSYFFDLAAADAGLRQLAIQHRIQIFFTAGITISHGTRVT